ncbi:MAG: hypothetical protein ABIG28_02470 [archaeon]
MDKRLRVLVGMLFVFVLIAFVHSAVHFYFFGAGFFDRGISGLAVDGSEVDGKPEGGLGDSISQILVVAEWIFVLVLLIFSYARSKKNFEKEVASLKNMGGVKLAENGTEIDKLYEILKEMKTISFPAVEEVFDIDREVVKGWAETLRLGNLARVDYPRIGEPEIVLIEKKGEDKG